MSFIRIIDFNKLGDERGQLFSLEQDKNIPFSIKRVYYMVGMKEDLPRGFHAHKDLLQIAVCIKGSCDMWLDDGSTRELMKLNSPSKGIFINKMIWHEIHNFSDDCVLVVLASDYYDEGDYIRDYQDFKLRIERERNDG